MAIFSVFQLLSVVSLALFLVGLLNVYLSDGENGCEMTYMYEYPQFVRIKVPDDGVTHQQYGLYAYSEGRFTERARKMRFDGIPVLFLPGNMGSHKQVRSLASVALRKALPLSKYGFHFDYFTIDFNEEMSGLYGGVLDKQAQFSTLCLKAILGLYQNNKPNIPRPKSVIVIGHSMGGTVAKLLLAFPQNKNIIDVMITLATPHDMPIVAIDPYFRNVYSRINNFWDLKNVNTTNLAPIAKFWMSKVLVTIGGGEKDLLVPSALTTSVHSDIAAVTTSIPGVWLSTDHLCIVWCKQLVLVVNRFLFSIIDTETKQLSMNPTHIINMGKHFFKIGYSKNYSVFESSVDFLPEANWHEDSRRQYSFKHEKVINTIYYMVRLVDWTDYEAVTFETVDLDDNEWLFGCQAKYVHGQYRICMNGRHLSHFSRWKPSKRGKRRIASIDLRALHASYPHWTHVLLKVSPTNRPVEINVDVHSKGMRQVQATLPPWYSVSKGVVVKETSDGALQYNISVAGLDMLYQSYLLYVEPLGACSTVLNHANAELVVPWANGYEYYDFFTETEQAPMKIRLSKGNVNFKNNTQQVIISVMLDPKCKYKISIATSHYDVLGQLSRNYLPSLPAYFAAVLLLVLRHWTAAMESKALIGKSFHSALCGEYVKPYYLMISARLGALFMISFPVLKKLSKVLTIASSSSQSFILLPLILYMVALGLAHILGAVCWGFLIFSGQVAHRVILRLVSFGKSGGGSKFWEWVAKEIRNAPGIGGFLLIAIGLGSCGAASLLTGAAFYFFLLTKMYEDYLEDFVYKTIAKVAKKFKEMNKKKKEDITNTENGEDKNIDDKTAAPVDDSESIKSSEICETTQESTIIETKSVDCVDNAIKTNQTTDETVADESNKDVKTSSNSPERKISDGGSSESALESLHFHFAMFFIWCLVTILNIPTLLTWAHNFKYSKVLEADPSFYPSIIMSASAFSLWQIDTPKHNIKYYNVLNKIIYIAAVLVVMITPAALYRLNYILSGIFLIITLHQTFPFKCESEMSIEDRISTEDIISDDASGSNDTVPNPNVIREQTPSEILEKIKHKLETE